MHVKKNGGTVLDNGKISIDGMPIGVFTGSFELGDAERDRIIQTCKKIWRHLRRERVGGVDPVGLHRFDLVPAFSRSNGDAGYLGELYAKGIYEVNGHSPECLAAASMIRRFYPEIPCVNAAEIVAKKIMAIYGDVPIAFVVGYGSALKASWYHCLAVDLVAAGLNLTTMTPEEVMDKKPLHIWRWGDVREDGENDYKNCESFTRWLYEQNECTVFNRVLQPEDDVTNKNLLLSSSDPDIAALLGNNCVLDVDAIHWSTEENQYQSLMAKPDRGSSGKGLVFGEHYSRIGWIRELEFLIKEKFSYSLWQAQWLPAISVGNERLAIDFNPAFWVDGDDIDYLYTIIRADPYDRYRKERKINVSQGAGIAGLIY